MKQLGRHILVEFYDCDPEVLDDLDAVKHHMVEAALRSGATVVGEIFHKFTPQGVSGAVVIAESHLAIHTWPEYGFCAMDLFTCGDTVNPWVGFEYLRDRFRAGRADTKEMARGLREAIGCETLSVKPVLELKPLEGRRMEEPAGSLSYAKLAG